MQEKTAEWATVSDFSRLSALVSSNGGADGIVSDSLKKTQEKPQISEVIAATGSRTVPR
jgi:hypothetical protein